MKVLAFLAAIVAVASAVNPAALYRTRCSEGASYWCETAMRADECGAVEYCIQNHWRGKLAQESAVCSDCEAFVNGVHNVLDQTTTQALILEGAKEACVVMGALSTLCDTMVETLGPEVLKQLVSELTMDEVCQVLGFCKHQVAKEESPELCSLCELGMTELHQVLSDTSVQQDIENELLSVCPLLQSFLPNCADLVKENFPMVIQLLLQYANAQTCTDLGVCPGNAELQKLFENIRNLKFSAGMDFCATCKSVTGNIDSFLSNPAVQTGFKLEMDQLCYTLGATAGTLCRYLVDTYSQQIFATLVQFLNPNTFCAEVGLCSASMTPRPVIQVDASQCADCEAFLQDISGMLTNVTVQTMLTADLEAVCAQLGSFAAQCKGYVDSYAPLAFTFLATYVNPQEICQGIGFCNARQLTFTPVHVEVNADTCTDCKAFVGDIAAMLTNQTVQNMVIQELEQVCASLGSFADQCKSLVDQFGPLAFTFLASEINPDEVCGGIGFCPSSLMKKVEDPKVCQDCIAFFKDVDAMLTNATFQKKVLTQLEQLCSQAGSLEAECKLLVQTYGPMLFTYLVTYMEPTTVCSSLGFCGSDAVTAAKVQPMTSLIAAKPHLLGAVLPPFLAENSAKTTDVEDCSSCEMIVKLFLPFLESNKTEEEILAALAEVCDLLPEDYQMECKNDVSTYGYIIIEMLKQEISPEAICKELGECASKTKLPSKQNQKIMNNFKSILSKLPVADTPFCAVCQLAVQEVDTILSSNKTKEEIKADFEKYVCGSLPASVMQECDSFMNVYGDMLIQLLLEQFDAKTFCVDVGLCDATKAPKVKFLQPVQLKASPECIVCELIVQELDSVLSDNATEGEIRAALDQVCGDLPATLAPECKELVNTYTEEIIKYLINEFQPAALCGAIGVCSSEKEVQAKKPVLPDATYECILCEYMVSELEPLLPLNGTEVEIREALDKVCYELPLHLGPECKEFVNVYLEEIVQYLVKGFSPEFLCRAIDACSSTERPNPKSFELLRTQRQDPDPAVECVLCEYVLAYLDSVLEENATREEIEKAVASVCEELPSTIKEDCITFKDTYEPLIINYLLTEKPKEICALAHICLAANLVTLVKPSGSGECAICELVMRELETELSGNATEAEIQAALDEVCDVLPSTVRADCEAFVNLYTPLLLKYLVDTPPSEICALIGLCSQKAILVKPVEATVSVECAICESVMHMVDKELSSNATQEEIKQVLDEVCDKFSSSVKDDCEAFVTTYEPLLLKYLLEEKPEEICALFKLCPGSSLKVKLGSVDCELCQLTVRELLNAIQEPSVTKEIVLLVNDTCDVLPIELKTECYSYVNQYGDLVTEFIAQFFDPITSCTLMGECPTPSNAPVPAKRLLGQNECSRGPGYWCASQDNAKQCGMVEHCKRHVWN